jgi:hypothetical protein
MGSNSRISLALLLIAVTAWYVFYPSDKKRIKKVIDNSTQAIIKKDIDELMDHVSFNYRDEYGGTYLLFKKRMEGVFARFEDIEIEADIMGVNVDNDQADARLRMSAVVTEGTDRGYIIGDGGTDEDVKVYLEKSPYEWKVFKVERTKK